MTNTFWVWNHAAHGDLSPEDAFARLDAMIEASPDRFAVASICGFGATTAITLGRWDEVEHFVEIGNTADASSQFAFWAGQFLMQRGIVQARRGHVDEGIALFEEGKARYTGVGGRSGMSTFEATLALNVAEQGRVDDAARLVGNARTELDTYGERWNEPVVLLAEAVVAAARGDRDGAGACLARAADVATGQGAHTVAARAAAVAADLGLEIGAEVGQRRGTAVEAGWPGPG